MREDAHMSNVHQAGCPGRKAVPMEKNMAPYITAAKMMNDKSRWVSERGEKEREDC
jgi:hypothetical protein